MRASRAFTLIELLVVITVIAILAALVLSVLNRTRATSQATTCLCNLRQWGTALHLFAADHEDFLPPEGRPTPTAANLNNPSYQAWYIQLPEQMNLPRYRDMPWRTNWLIHPGNSIWICPANSRRCDASSLTNNLFHYCLNGLIDGSGANDHPMAMASIRNPSCVVYLFDSKNLPAVHCDDNHPGNFVHTNLHNRGAQFVFVDNHVARFRNNEYWDFTAGRGVTNNSELVWIP
jgi:prepilin-type N-terminal cleavage/methylation domain-containing protein/prepilin-type processing-associated H-X9-DG protein